MAEITTIARPYAEAVFKLAREKGNASQWSDMLAWLAAVASDSRISSLVGDPRIGKDQLAGLIRSVSEGKLDADGQQLVGLLVENHRVPALPAIRDQYEALRHEDEGVLDASVTSAFPLSDGERDALVNDLQKRFGRSIRAEVAVDPSLIGGVKITVGDVVIDGSVRARIDQMAVALKH